MGNKYNLPLTCEVITDGKTKIQAVKDGDCYQTIRPLKPDNPKELGDYVHFHGWAGKPYESKWEPRMPEGGYWKINRTFKVKFYEHMDTEHGDIGMYYQNKTIFADEENKWIKARGWLRDAVAHADWFATYKEMVSWFLNEYDREEVLNTVYKAIRWDPAYVFKEE